MEELAKLVNSNDSSVITINNSTFSIGRSLSCDHIIPSLGISRFHCVIKKTVDKWTLFDRSSNGTVVNSTQYKFNESVDLKNGDIIKLGPENLDFVFTVEKPGEKLVPEAVNEEVILSEEIATSSNEEVIPIDVINEFQQPLELEGKTDKTHETGQNLDIMENELTCSICAEFFVKAVTLNCSHTFCKYCIEQWRRNKSTCPICRKRILTVAPTLVLDNFIEKIIETQSDEMKESRKQLIKHREEVVDTMASSSVKHADNADVIELFSDPDDSDVSYSDHDTDDDYDDYYSRPYYGGYGRCFVCNQRGHWANSCPLKRR